MNFPETAESDFSTPGATARLLHPQSGWRAAAARAALRMRRYWFWAVFHFQTGGLRAVAKRIWRRALLAVRLGKGFDDRVLNRQYPRWIAKFEPSAAELQALAAQALGFEYQPTVSIVVPVYRTPPGLLRACIESVCKQIYTRWELCLADDGSGDPALTQLLQEYASSDPRIKFLVLAKNGGISAASNAALTLATGDFVAFLDHDDELSPDALYWSVRLLQEQRDADVIYSDEDKLDTAGKRYEPFFKPDWSPDLLLSCNYICHFLVARRTLVNEVGAFRSGYDGSQDHDLILRLSERTPRIHHIPRILYHWRATPVSTAFAGGAKPQAQTSAQRAISDHLQRNSIRARVEPGCSPGRWNVRYEVLERPKVAIIMPCGGNLKVARPCLEALFKKTSYPHYEVLVVDNSQGSDVQQLLRDFAGRNGSLRHIDWRGRRFNFSAMNNQAVQTTTAPLLLFLNDDTTVVNSEWLTALVEHGQRPTVGAVGGKLLYPSGMIQHAGVVMGLAGNCDHAFRHLPSEFECYFDFAQIARNCSAVTGACLMTRRELFLELGGFDEAHLPVAFQDVDYCLRLRQRGYSVVYAPLCLLLHREAVSKRPEDGLPSPQEVKHMQRKWAAVIANDPFYSPNLTRRGGGYRLRWS